MRAFIRPQKCVVVDIGPKYDLWKKSIFAHFSRTTGLGGCAPWFSARHGGGGTLCAPSFDPKNVFWSFLDRNITFGKNQKFSKKSTFSLGVREMAARFFFHNWEPPGGAGWCSGRYRGAGPVQRWWIDPRRPLLAVLGRFGTFEKNRKKRK